ncbi:MAG: hypothetical protein RL235_479 [Chlamydiota bacterium]|jgi:hypothetical protein
MHIQAKFNSIAERAADNTYSWVSWNNKMSISDSDKKITRIVKLIFGSLSLLITFPLMLVFRAVHEGFVDNFRKVKEAKNRAPVLEETIKVAVMIPFLMIGAVVGSLAGLCTRRHAPRSLSDSTESRLRERLRSTAPQSYGAPSASSAPAFQPYGQPGGYAPAPAFPAYGQPGPYAPAPAFPAYGQPSGYAPAPAFQPLGSPQE